MNSLHRYLIDTRHNAALGLLQTTISTFAISFCLLFNVHRIDFSRFLQIHLALGQRVLIFEQSSKLFQRRSLGLRIEEPNDRGFDREPYDVNDVEPKIWSTITFILVESHYLLPPNILNADRINKSVLR